jgi:hypothetical protein
MNRTVLRYHAPAKLKGTVTPITILDRALELVRHSGMPAGSRSVVQNRLVHGALVQILLFFVYSGLGAS